MAKSKPPLEVVDTSRLTDEDWVALNKLKAAYDTGGPEALSKAFDELDPVRYTNIMKALYPDMVSEVIKDKTSKLGVTEDDFRDLLRNLEGPSPKSH